MSSVLEFRKRSLKLRSRLKKSLQKNTSNEFINQLKPQKIRLPFAQTKWCISINNFLTKKDCKSFINFLHKNRVNIPNQKASTKPKPILPQRMRPRGLTWTINRNEEISNLIFERCFHFLPKIWINKNDNTIWEISGINNDIKSLKCSPGDVLCP
eukprot:745876_1